MASLEDIAVSAFINILSAIGFLLAFAVLRVQPINSRVYYPKLYINGLRSSPRGSMNGVLRFVNFNIWSYIVSFLGWMPEALKMSQTEIIQHAGLDSAIYLRIYILGFWVHLCMAYIFTLWTSYMLYMEYDNVAFMRLHFLASQHRRVEQFTVVVRNVPQISGHSIAETVDHFFQKNHPDHYLSHQAVYNANRFAKLVRQKERLQNWLDYNQIKFERNPDKRPTSKIGFLGLCGRRVDSIEYYKQRIKVLDNRIASEHQKIIKDPKAILPVAFVTFGSRWGAAVCAQTQQSKNPTLWLTEWAPEPRDVYWKNLSIPFVSLSIRRLIISISVFSLVFFYMIPITFVQSLANLEGLEKVAPFLRPVIEFTLI
ncbi:CSC1-like protein At1g32090 isoform X2 [Dendrobium catenatum]|uniref:CSC1-like protein At1g32090 isoform X2 n=1 Tax=Dendrobium catenatum TaxID=906689 RepID=UPI00109F2220|nr:CSC1-like protein At1g32090 isoform X2 [Dendrobium catenatum]